MRRRSVDKSCYLTGATQQHLTHCKPFESYAFSSPEPTILLTCGRNRELWEQPFRACAIDEGWVKPDGQNSVISFVISKWLLPELSIPAEGQKDRRLWGREWVLRSPHTLLLFVRIRCAPTWRPENCVNIWNLRWLSRRLSVLNKQAST